MSQQLLLFINILTPILKHFTNIELTKPLQETIHECIMHRILSNQQDEYNIYIYSDDHIVLQRADGTFMSSKRNFNVSIEYYTILRNHILNLYAFEDSHRCNDKVINICKDINDENFNTLCDYSVIDRRLNRCKLMNFEYQIGDLLFEICRLENDEVDVIFENDFVTIYKFDDNFVEENSIDREMFDRKIEQRDEKNIVENKL
ncbi:hypothetical protein NAPIS_ORF02108 [Vairimorpha apis BRL 01]|uniref:Uncharacterized protein n=1 Tax=Vairimorpha apis BRL 01 TaxID=1037528 RepID=T0MAA1_9MICR|nr:hypothetical protein NAPIS_ORF02108 [Vairimorpha apis BRL 01]